jgi:hypothetical protein
MSEPCGRTSGLWNSENDLDMDRNDEGSKAQ